METCNFPIDIAGVTLRYYQFICTGVGCFTILYIYIHIYIYTHIFSTNFTCTCYVGNLLKIRCAVELGDIPVLSLYRDKNPTSRNDISIAFVHYYRFLRKLLARVVELMWQLHAHDRLKEQLVNMLLVNMAVTRY